jgi:hypothetical protein
MILWHVNNFHNFFILFVFYTILKQPNDKFMVLFREYGAQKFWSATEIGHNLC